MSKNFRSKVFFCLHERAEFLGRYLGLARIEENNKIGSTSTSTRLVLPSSKGEIFRVSTEQTFGKSNILLFVAFKNRF